MPLQLYDTYSRAVRNFTPRRGRDVSIYICGPTVVAPPHVGQLRCQVSFDVLARWLKYHGCTVDFVPECTDMEDMILRRALVEKVPWWLIGKRIIVHFSRPTNCSVACRRTVEPRATGHITEMIELIEELLRRRHAYVVDGDVYFSVASFPEYGRLSRRRAEHMRAAAEPGRGKRHPCDFALWKRAKPGEPYWRTPWGAGGRAGTCSAR